MEKYEGNYHSTKEFSVTLGDVTPASKEHKATRKATTKGSSMKHVRLKARLTRCKHVCLKALVLCIITHFPFSCPQYLGFKKYILCSFVFEVIFSTFKSSPSK